MLNRETANGKRETANGQTAKRQQFSDVSFELSTLPFNFHLSTLNFKL
jgi:hypothetical protein